MSIAGATFETVASFIAPPISQPRIIGASVAPIELIEQPIWTSWLPLLPPPPSLFSMGLTTVLSRHMEKPAMNAPSR